MIYTFYSYKGGVGRSMALANVADLFHRAGLRVLLVDWDLEAPGLERFFPTIGPQALSHVGLVDLLEAYKRMMAVPGEDKGEDLILPNLETYCLDVYQRSANPLGARLLLMPAGRRDAEHFQTYAQIVLGYDWQGFYEKWSGEIFFEWLRQQFRELADVVLIDSRTGVTEMGGVCTYHLADVVVMFCGANEQNIDGTLEMAKNFKNPDLVTYRQGRPLELLIIPTRIDKADSTLVDEFQAQFIERFAEFDSNQQLLTSRHYWELHIPYRPKYAFRETLAVQDAGKASAEDIISAYLRLTYTMLILAPQQPRIAAARLWFEEGGGSALEHYPITSWMGGESDIWVYSNFIKHSQVNGVGFIEALPFQITRYLTYLVDMYQYLDFQGMGVSDRVPLQLKLLEVYVPLKARVELPQGETWGRERRLAEHNATEGIHETIGEQSSSPQLLLDLLNKYDGLVVLGDPGAGKTTFLRHLTLVAAMGEGEALGLKQRVPFLLPLARYAEVLAARDVAFKLFLVSYVEELLGNEVTLGALLDDALAKGEALLLLDGLDEVRDDGVRRRVVERVRQFYALHRRAGNKFILSGRIVGYSEVRPPTMDGLAECVLVDFKDEEIEEFIAKWITALERAAHGQGRVAEQAVTRERAELLHAVHHNPGVRQLTANPLLLTILMLMKRQGVALPKRRVELYHTAVQTLVRNWNLARSEEHTTRPVTLDTLETVRVLAPLALWIHESSPGVGLVPHEALHERLRAILVERGVAAEEAEGAARRFLDDVRQHTALLLDRGGRRYGFINLAFQEYLAGVAIARLAQPNVEPMVQLLAANVGDPLWREVSLLAIGYLGIIMQQEQAAGAVLSALIRRTPGELGEALLLAAEAVLDAWPGGVTAACRDEVITALLPAMLDPAIPIVRRAALGSALGRLGDPRFDPDHWHLPREPLLGFVEIPAGPFLMGSDPKRDPDATDDEQPQHELILPACWLARYPVTVAQWCAFVESSGFKPGDTNSLRGVANHPVVWVSWYEALAYCDWLTKRMREVAPRRLAAGGFGESQQRFWEGFASGQGAITLPSEAEWEKGARGADRRTYPWGDAFDPARVNFNKTAIASPSAVGAFASGASPYGLQDMSGNVWEWTRSIWGKNPSGPDFTYPYKVDDGRENLASIASRQVQRGGSYAHPPHLQRPTTRKHGYSSKRYGDVGFRVAAISTRQSDAPLISQSP